MGFSRVDLATVVMLSLFGGLAIVCAVYFYTRWRLKARQKQVQVTVQKRERVKKTFSRFSQVDEELTVYPLDSDLEILQRYSVASTSKMVPVSDTSKVTSGVKHDRPYLETDM